MKGKKENKGRNVNRKAMLVAIDFGKARSYGGECLNLPWYICFKFKNTIIYSYNDIIFIFFLNSLCQGIKG
jgi:hypothetical protein